MKSLFLTLVVANLALAWFPMQQPALDTNKHGHINLPRVTHLKLLSEAPELPEPIIPPTTAPPQSNASTPGNPPSSGSERIDGDPIDLAQPLLPDLFRVPEDGSAPFLVGKLEPSDTEELAQCQLVSGFANRDRAEQWLEGIEDELYAQAEPASRPIAGEPLHWILTPPRRSRTEGLQLLRNLQRSGIDSYLITEGPRANAISLGLFESRRAAESVLHQRRQSGIDAHLTEYPRLGEEFFVVVSAASPRALAESLPAGVETSIVSEVCEVLHW